MKDNDSDSRAQCALAKIADVCAAAARGDLSARVVGREGFSDEIQETFDSLNQILDMSDSFVREAGAALRAAGEGRYHRQFLLAGMLGDFRRGAALINDASSRMREMEEATVSEREVLAGDFRGAVMSVVKTVAETSSEIANSSRAMAAAATHSDELCGAMFRSVTGTSDEIGAVAKGMQQLSKAIDEISNQVSDGDAVATQGVVKEVGHAKEAVKGLVEAAGKIDNVVNFIREVAEQTNLLALNATIEAARAGAAGQGFAVVANEVKALAYQTAEATSDIDREVGAIQAASDNTASAIGRISDLITGIDERVTLIAAAVEKQSAATHDISASVDGVAVQAQRLGKDVEKASGAAAEAGASAESQLATAERLAGLSRDLDNEVSGFLDALLVR